VLENQGHIFLEIIWLQSYNQMNLADEQDNALITSFDSIFLKELP
jgi:hypothetical protein